MHKDKLRYKEIWSGQYRGVAFEIHHWNKDSEYQPDGTWNFYLFLNQKQFTPGRWERLWLSRDTSTPQLSGGYCHYDYPSMPIAQLDWHGGITYYAKTAGFDDSTQIIKVGCDYNHLWDEGMWYDEQDVAADIRATVDGLWELYPDMLVWNQRTGECVTEEVLNKPLEKGEDDGTTL